MNTRRDFMKELAALAGAAGLIDVIQKAAAIEPEAGSQFLDAEHVVILMQENRSFDHAFGSLRGVRGFNDPRAIRLPDGNPVWVQSTKAGEKYVPFRLDIKNTKTTWMGCLPHGWADQVDATNGGKHDRWLDVKKSGNRNYAAMPLTLGYHTRDDIPFYYALADAFTICDQNFCSTLTGTTPNRLHLWTGTIREKPTAETPAYVRNEDCDYGSWCHWKTFPERLEDHGVSWNIYQNELTVPSGLSEEGDAWLANFGCNPIEWFPQFNVRYAPLHRKYVKRRIGEIPGEIEKAKAQLAKQTNPATDRQLRTRITQLQNTLKTFQQEFVEFTDEGFAKLSPREKSLYARAFITNEGDPAYRELEELSYQDGDKTHKLNVPKGDVFFQFRKDVNEGKLPTVSWMVPPERFSDHPCSAWYGQWYLSEVLNILTKNPEVWKKTIFILTYDENDGYFDHIPPFQAPHPKKPESGLASKGIDTTREHLELEVDRKHKPSGAVRGNSLGLGYRVPMIIASPWSRGGNVCSQVFDHTSPVRFIETWLTHKTGKKIEETNITKWRRTVCGDLTSSFQPTVDEKPGLSEFVARDPFIGQIHKAQFRDVPKEFHPLSAAEVDQIREKSAESILPKQESGVRRACPLPYQLVVDGKLNQARTAMTVRFSVKNDQFGAKSAGAPFIAYASTAKGMAVRHYAVEAGDAVEDAWPLADFEKGEYHLRIHGPNGFFREFHGSTNDPAMTISFDEVREGRSLTGDVELNLIGLDLATLRTLQVRDVSYAENRIRREGVSMPRFIVESSRSKGWYDVVAQIPGTPFFKRYAGRVETGRWSISDPAMSDS